MKGWRKRRLVFLCLLCCISIYVSLHAPSQVHLPKVFSKRAGYLLPPSINNGIASVSSADANVGTVVAEALLSSSARFKSNERQSMNRVYCFQFTSFSFWYCKQTLRLSSLVHLVASSFLRISSIPHPIQHGLRSSCPLHLRCPCGVYYSCWSQEDYWLRVSTGCNSADNADGVSDTSIDRLVVNYHSWWHPPYKRCHSLHL